MMRARRWPLAPVCLLLLLWLAAVGAGPPASAPDSLVPRTIPGISPAKHEDNVFKNLDPKFRRASYAARLQSLILGGTWFLPEFRVAPLALAAADIEGLRHYSGKATVTWIGHATVLVQIDGVTFLTDPIWATRSGPFSGLVGVSRYTPPPIKIADLPPIDFVLISHDHYDHLDEPTVRELARRFDPLFIVPVGLKSWLADRDITNAVELSWGQAITVKGLTVVCAPAQHASGRTMVDQNRRLWASWAVLGSERFFFGGDTGYSASFKQVGDVLGPFGLAALPIGSYTPIALARPVHMSPEDALQAWTDLRGEHFLGIHWGTFGLARERYDEPPQRLRAEVERRGLDPTRVWVLKPGETAHW